MTKEELLFTMKRLNACRGGAAWVRSQDGPASEILLRCHDVDWLIWLLGRLHPIEIAEFAVRCADRASSHACAAAVSARTYAAAARTYAAAARTYADEYADEYADKYAELAKYAADYAELAADRAKYAFAVNSADSAAEHSRQLVDLREIVTAHEA